jgi:hypothetical protein
VLPLSLLAVCSLEAGGQQSNNTQVKSAASKKAVPPAGQAAPPAPQSTHFPILLLAVGSDQSWSLRIGQKGPERLDRNGYPPIPLEPADVAREGTSDTWTYNAKDSQTGAAVAVHITRQPCLTATDSAPGAPKFVFAASIEHAQIGTLTGCARIAPELFPKINNKLNDDDEDDDTPKPPPPPTVTKFKLPVEVAYVSANDRMVVKRGTLTKTVPGKAGYDLSLSHDGKKLLFIRDEQPNPLRTLNEYDFTTGETKELLRANVRKPFWSPDDTQIAFLEFVDGKWQVWTMPQDAPEKAAALYPSPGEVITLHGWVDAHTILGGDLQVLSWIGDDGSVKQTLTSADLYGKGQFGLSSANTVRVHPLNPDLLLVSAELAAPLPPPPAPPNGNDTGAKDAGKKQQTLATQAFFLYEVRAKRRVILSSPNQTSSQAEWSHDGLQIYFTGRDPLNNSMTIYRVFWDGTSQTKYRDGWGLVIGE